MEDVLDLVIIDRHLSPVLALTECEDILIVTQQRAEGRGAQLDEGV